MKHKEYYVTVAVAADLYEKIDNPSQVRDAVIAYINREKKKAQDVPGLIITHDKVVSIFDEKGVSIW